MERNRFKVSKDLKRFIRVVLLRNEIPHRFVREEGQWYCNVPISGERFHKIVQRAFCEKQSKKDGVFYLTYRESKDPSLMQALLETFNCNGFVIISKEKLPAKQNFRKDR